MDFNKIKSNLEKHQDVVINSMTNTCSNLNTIMKQTTLETDKNNVINYNIQRLYGQCYLIDEKGAEIKPIELLGMNGCGKLDNTKWTYKDTGLFDFCPNFKPVIYEKKAQPST